jgi:carbon-monoxide dehydrogenase medium subunit
VTAGAELSFARPRSLEELRRVLAAAPDDALLLSGGMTAMPYLNRGEWTTSAIVSVTAVPELRGIEVSDDALVIGAATTHTELTTDPLVAAHAAVLAEAAAAVGDVQVRNRGTIGGTVAFANSGADHVTALTALDAVVVLLGAAGVRRVPMRSFVVGRRATVRGPREVVLAVEVPRDPAWVGRYLRLTRVQGASPVLTLVAERGTAGTVLCIGGATGRPLLLPLDLAAGDDELRATVRAAVVEPIGDAWSPAPYRQAMAAELSLRVVRDLRDALADALPDALPDALADERST